MRRIEIPSFVDKESGIHVKKTVAYVGENKAVLYESTGHIMLVSLEILKSLKVKKIPTPLINKLISRSFTQTRLNCEESCDKCSIESKPEFFMIDLTNKCNMNCTYCLRDIDNNGMSVSKETVFDICRFIVKYCEDNKIKNITIQPWGGEPLIEFDLILLMRELIKVKDTKVHFSVETNALLLDERKLQDLYNNKIGLGISIDGFKEVHDSQRVCVNGNGTHEIVEKNLLHAREIYGERLGTITTITKNNYEHIGDVLEYFATKLNLTSVKFNFVHESMFSSCSDICLSEDEIANTVEKLINKIIELNERGYKIVEYNLKVKLKNLLFKEYSDICHSRGCCGGKKMIVFDMNGAIYPCELTDTPSESIGSIYDGISLSDIISNSLPTRDFFVPKINIKCRNCDWYVFCQGGCTSRIISKGQRPPEIDEIECAVNLKVYPMLIDLILHKPNIVNQILGSKILEERIKI